MEDKYVIKALAALAQPNRLQIFRSLVVKGHEGLTIYRAQYDRMNAVLSYLSENCCQGDACEVSPEEVCKSC